MQIEPSRSSSIASMAIGLQLFFAAYLYMQYWPSIRERQRCSRWPELPGRRWPLEASVLYVGRLCRAAGLDIGWWVLRLGSRNSPAHGGCFFAGLGLALAGLSACRRRPGQPGRRVASQGWQAILSVAFSGGAIMGMSVALGLFGLASWCNASVTRPIRNFEHCKRFCSASSIALFLEWGGIYTKAADVGADLVGKVESGIPEDDPRNPPSSPTTWRQRRRRSRHGCGPL